MLLLLKFIRDRFFKNIILDYKIYSMTKQIEVMEKSPGFKKHTINVKHQKMVTQLNALLLTRTAGEPSWNDFTKKIKSINDRMNAYDAENLEKQKKYAEADKQRRDAERNPKPIFSMPPTTYHDNSILDSIVTNMNNTKSPDFDAKLAKELQEAKENDDIINAEVISIEDILKELEGDNYSNRTGSVSLKEDDIIRNLVSNKERTVRLATAKPQIRYKLM